MITTEPPTVNPQSRYSLPEAACLLGVSRQTVHNWVAGKRIKVQYRKINNQAFVTGTEIRRAWEQYW